MIADVVGLVQPALELGLIPVLGVIIGLLVAGVIKGATGIGYATCALPLVAAFVGLKPAMALVIVPTLAVNASLAFAGGHFKANMREHGVLYAAMVPGVGAGVVLLAVVDTAMATAGLGATMIAYACYASVKPTSRLSPEQARFLRLPVGLATGMITGLTGSQVMPLVPYMLAAEMSPGQSIAAVNVAVLLLSVLLGVGLILSSAVDASWIAASAAAALPALAGAAIGAGIQNRLPTASLRALVLGMIGLLGAKMLLGG